MAPKRRLAAVLSADVVGYARLMAEDDQGTIQTLTAYREALGTLVEQHQGRVVDFTGDNLLAEFPSALDAVQCAVEIQELLQVRNQSLPENRRMLFRVGVHLGDLTAEGERIYGDGVNIAARLEGLAQPGGICISGAVHEQVENRLKLAFEDLGEQSVKNIPRPVRAYRILLGSSPATASPRPSWGRRGILATGLLLVAAGVALWSFYPRSPPESETRELPDKPSIAVLPFTNMSGDPEQEYFSDGITEDLITDLSKISGLFVIARNSTFTYKGKPVRIQDVSRDLGVAYVLEGSVRKAEDRVRITAQLIDGLTGNHLWADRYDRDLRDVFALQSEVARAIAREVRVTLTPEEEGRLSAGNDVNPEAHEAYLRGRYFWNKRNAEGFRRAIAYFESAIEADPSYAAAYAGLADCHLLMAAYELEPATEAMPRSEAAARKALEIDDTVAEAHASLAWMLVLYHRDWPAAEQSFRRAIELDPRYPSAHHWRGLSLQASGRAGEALVELRRAQELDPLGLRINFDLGEVYRLAGDYERAIDQYLHVIELDPDFPFPYMYLAAAHARRGEYEEALAALRPEDPRATWVYALAGEREEALRRLDALARASEPGYTGAYWHALGYAALGDDERALEWLERGYEEHSSMMTLYVKIEPVLLHLHSAPRFQDLLRRMNLPGAS